MQVVWTFVITFSVLAFLVFDWVYLEEEDSGHGQ